jgi:hypothetical protein
VEGVAGLASVDVAVQGSAEEREVSDEVENLVSHELVTETQGAGKDARVIEHHGVV